MPIFSAIAGATLKSISMPPAINSSASRSSPLDQRETTFLFDLGYLTIKNPYILRCDSGESVDANYLTGCRVTLSYQDKNEFVIVFDGRIYLSVSLLEEDFISQDAVIYKPASGNAVIIR